MSADNWRVCPACKKNREKRLEKQERALKASYGKVSAEEYEERRVALAIEADESPKMTLREDYSQRMRDDGVYEVGYSCSCQSCKFTFKFEHEVQASI